MRQIRHEQMERMGRSMRPGTSGGGGRGGSFDPSTGYGHSAHTRWEDDTVVHDSYHLFKGYEIAVTERLHFAEHGKAIRYTVKAKGPKGEPPVLNELIFNP